MDLQCFDENMLMSSFDLKSMESKSSLCFTPSYLVKKKD